MIKLRHAFYIMILALCCCKKAYNPPASSSPNNYLVVEGIINTGSDTTTIKISNTVKLTDKVTENPVLGAVVIVEGEQNGSYPLYDVYNNGHYKSSSSLNLSSAQRYRLRIKTNNNEYLSDFVEVKPTPPIDSIGYNLQNDIVNLYVNTHDPANKTRYYRWEYDETWIFHSKYDSGFVLDSATNTIQVRALNQLVYYCFANEVSPHIILNSTEKLSKDVVYQSPLTQFPLTDEKIEKKYSILVRQYAVTPDAYAFYLNIQKNTEQLGSIFDAQPSQLNGNIHSVNNPKEVVIGFITATNVQSKRIFIAHEDFPGNVQPNYPFDCEEDTAYYKNPATGVNQVQNTLINPPINRIPTRAIYAAGKIIGYLYSTIPCTVCTVRGTTQTPPFWQ